MHVQRLECQVAVVALSQQHAQRAITLSPLVYGIRKPSAQQRDRTLELSVGRLGSERILHEISLEAPLQQRSPDALGSPLVELALVGGELARVPSVIEVALISEHLDRTLGLLGRNAATD